MGKNKIGDKNSVQLWFARILFHCGVRSSPLINSMRTDGQTRSCDGVEARGGKSFLLSQRSTSQKQSRWGGRLPVPWAMAWTCAGIQANAYQAIVLVSRHWLQETNHRGTIGSSRAVRPNGVRSSIVCPANIDVTDVLILRRHDRRQQGRRSQKKLGACDIGWENSLVSRFQVLKRVETAQQPARVHLKSVQDSRTTEKKVDVSFLQPQSRSSNGSLSVEIGAFSLEQRLSVQLACC